jgi:steroid 5-alpha reductase family enzyme
VSPFTATFLVTLLAFGALWWVSVQRRDASIVDVYWGPGFAVIAAVAIATGAGTDPRRFLVVTLVFMWGFRLGAYLFWRKRERPGEDFRYAAMRRRFGDEFRLMSLFNVFLLQAALMWIVSWPVQWVVTTPSDERLGLLDALGFGLWAVGLAFETLGDLQLVDFRTNPANAGKVLDTGLWRYTRHPNYFGDFCVWWGFYAFACATPNGWWTFVGPVVMSILLLRVTGVPLLERSLLAEKPDYAAYVARTSAFFPMFPRPATPPAPSALRGDRGADGASPQ